jgi:enamine deaminase RidA (YjgF/YER057c/UK114 family)
MTIQSSSRTTEDPVSASNVSAESQLTSLGIELPTPPAAVGSYVSWAIANDILITSGQLPWRNGELLFAGKIGKELTPAQGYEACKLATLNAIAQLKEAVGDLARIKRILRIEGTLNVAPGFTDTPRILNGASDLVNQVFGARGRHTRMIYTNPEMPLDCACLIVFWAEIVPHNEQADSPSTAV